MAKWRDRRWKADKGALASCGYSYILFRNCLCMFFMLKKAASCFTAENRKPLTVFLFLGTAVACLHPERVMADGVVNYTGYAQYDDARRANQQAGASVVVTAERDNRGVVRGDVHGFYHAQVVVE